MIYIIDTYFAENRKEECIIVKTQKLTIEEMTNVVGALGNLYAQSKSKTFCTPLNLWNTLCSKFECKDKKHKYLGELEFIASRIQSPFLHATCLLYDEFIVWLDLKEAMRYTTGRMYNILGNYLSQDEIQMIEEGWRD